MESSLKPRGIPWGEHLLPASSVTTLVLLRCLRDPSSIGLVGLVTHSAATSLPLTSARGGRTVQDMSQELQQAEQVCILLN